MTIFGIWDAIGQHSVFGVLNMILPTLNMQEIEHILNYDAKPIPIRREDIARLRLLFESQTKDAHGRVRVDKFCDLLRKEENLSHLLEELGNPRRICYSAGIWFAIVWNALLYLRI